MITDFNWWPTVLSQHKSIGVILDQKNIIFAIETDASFLGWIAISQHHRTLKLPGMANVYHYPENESILTCHSLKLEYRPTPHRKTNSSTDGQLDRCGMYQ